MTVELAFLSILVAVLIGVPSASSQHAPEQPVRHDHPVASLVWLSVPGFWVATLLVLGASLYVPTWPTLGYIDFRTDPIGNLQTMLSSRRSR